MHWTLNFAAAAAGTVLMAACSQPPGTTLERIPLQLDEFFTTGARQRVITNSEIGQYSRPGLVDPQRVICTEPSPDAAVAVANSLGVGLSVLGQGSGSISSAQVEGLAQLVERTASIQLLRDKMYQSCLAYSNGAISGTTYSLIMSRLDDVIVTLLLGETAGGAFGRSQAGIGLEASAEASASLTDLSNRMDDLGAAADDLAAAEKEVTEAEQALDDAETAQSDPPTDAEKQKVTKAKTDLKDAKAKRDALLKLLQSGVATASKAAGKVTELKTGGGISQKPSAEIARTLEDMQASFLIEDYTEIYLSACLVELALQDESQTPASVGFDYLSADLADAQAELEGKPDDDEKKKRMADAKTAFEAYLTNAPLAKKDSLNPNNKLFSEFLFEWLEFGSDSRVNKSDLFMTAGLTRSSKLATFCVKELPGFLREARQDFEKFRTLRENVRANVKLGEASAKIRTAEASRLAEFRKALGTCGEITDDDLKADCHKLVMSGTLPTLTEASSD